VVEPFDIFLVLPNQELQWVEPAKTLPEAMDRIAQLGPGDYVIFNQTTGNKLAVKVPVRKKRVEKHRLRDDLLILSWGRPKVTITGPMRPTPERSQFESRRA
jgi:hypothetical protein